MCFIFKEVKEHSGKLTLGIAKIQIGHFWTYLHDPIFSAQRDFAAYESDT